MAQAGAFRQAAPEPQVSEFEKLLASIKANPESDPGAVNTIEQLLRVYGAEQEKNLTAKQQEQLRQQTAAVVEQTALNTIYLSMEDELKNHPGVAEYKDEIVGRVCKQFNTNPAYKEAKDKYNQGIIDPVVLRSICKEETEKFLNIRGGGVSARGPSGGARQDTTVAPGEDATGDIDAQIKSLSGKQEEMFNAMLTLQQKSGRHKDSKEAKAEALRLTRTMKKQ